MKPKTIFAMLFLSTLGLFLGAGMLSGCASHTASGTQESASSQAPPAKGGAQLWSENCARCHNMRSPSSYSDAQWEVTVHHMRFIAGLTGEQQRAITEFLKSAN